MNYTANDNLEIMKFAKNYNNFLINQVISIAKKNQCKTILDFGCSDGFFMETVSNVNSVGNIFGVEIDDTSYNECMKKNLKVYKDIDNIKYGFDLIYSFNVLEHIENDMQILQKFYDKLNANGFLILYVPALKFLFSSMDKKVGHCRRYTKEELTNKVNQNGFKIKKAQYCDSIGILATLLYIAKEKIFKNNNGDISKNSVILYDKIFPLSRLFDKLLFKNLCGKNLLIIAQRK